MLTINKWYRLLGQFQTDMEILENQDEWTRVFREGWLAHLRKTGQVDWRLYNHPRNTTAPAGPGINLKMSRLMLISSAGGYVNEVQEPFDAANPLGDYTYRLLPTEISFDRIKYAHDHYDHTFVEEDPAVALPLQMLGRMVLQGKIGMLASSVISIMGYQPDSGLLVDELVPHIIKIAKEHHVHAALLTPI